jgi:signal transduction histidine kinase
LGGMLQSFQVLRTRLLDSVPANQRAADEIGADLELLRKYMTMRDIPRTLNNIRDAGERATKIVSDMLNFARKSASSHEMHDLRTLVDQTIDIAATEYNLKKDYDFKQIEIVRKYEEKLPSLICEAGKIQQVVFNILRNGAEAMSEQRALMNDRKPTFTIEIKRASKPDFLYLSITDNGPGIVDDIRKHVFEPFFTTKKSGKGTGLGLSVSYFIITRDHGGEMLVECPPGGGASFVIILPIDKNTH